MASIFIYLQEEIKNRSDFKEAKGYKDCVEYYVGEIRIFRDGGGFYILRREVEDNIPEILRGVVRRVSLREWQSYSISRRICGKYSCKTASAVVDTQISNNEGGWDLRIIGNNFEDVKELYYKIRSGRILPSENWEAEQITEPPVKKKIKGFFGWFRS